MRIVNDADLTALNSFRVACRARALARLDHWYEIKELLDRGKCPAPWLVLGGGSNVLFRSDFPGTIILVANRGITPIRRIGHHQLVRVAAGENWDAFVRWTAAQGWWGIENLALIPGTVGAAPIQNIGAYGAEVSSCIKLVKAFDFHRGEWVDMRPMQCAFAYRDSTFKEQPDRYLITEVHFQLDTRSNPIDSYPGVKDLLEGKRNPGPQDMVDAITALRRRKLPDPAREPNAGSFFKNPVLAPIKWRRLREKWPQMPHFEVSGGVKISAGWLIDQSGLKGASVGDATVSKQHALVLINRGTASGEDVWRLARICQDAVYDKFGVVLEPEPLVV